jgi:hypothetical protein
MTQRLIWTLSIALWLGLPQPSVAQSENPVLDGSVDQQTLRLVNDGRGARLLGDLLLTLAPGATIAAAQDEHGSAVETRVEDDAKGRRVRLRALDLSSGSVLTVTYASGQVVSGRLPGLTVDAEMSTGPEVGRATGADLDLAWNALLSSLGARTVARPAGFAYFARWSVAGAPHFAATKNGRASREDLNQVASALNRGVYLHGDEAALTLDRALTTVEWRDGAAVSTGPRSALVHTAAFTDAKRPAERTIGLTIRDAFGGTVERHVGISSHGLVSDDARAVKSLVTALAGVSASDVGAPDPQDLDASYAPLASERSALNRLFVSSTRDGVVTPDELAVQVRLARQIAAK